MCIYYIIIMAFLAPEAIEGGLVLGEEAAPEIEEGGEDVARDVEEHEEGGMGGSSMQNMMMMQAMQQKQQPVVINNSNNNQQNYAYPQYAGWLQQQQPQEEQPITEQTEQPTTTPDVDSKNEKILSEEQKQLNQEEKGLAELQNKVTEATPAEQPDFIARLQNYSRIYQQNLATFNKQLDSVHSLFQQSKNYRFY